MLKPGASPLEPGQPCFAKPQRGGITRCSTPYLAPLGLEAWGRTRFPGRCRRCPGLLHPGPLGPKNRPKLPTRQSSIRSAKHGRHVMKPGKPD